MVISIFPVRSHHMTQETQPPKPWPPKTMSSTVRDLASQFRAFAFNETYALRFARLLRYDPLRATDGLFGLSHSLETYGGDRIVHRKIVQTALKIPEL